MNAGENIIYNIKVNLPGRSEEFPLEISADEKSHLLVKLQGVMRKWPKLAAYDSIQVFRKGEPETVYELPPEFLSAPLSVSIIGTGYVGLVTGVGLCHKGSRVICVDVDEEKVKKICARIPPIYEKGLKEMLESLPGKFFSCTTDLRRAVMDTDSTVIAVGTPAKENGDQELSYVRQAAKELGKILKDKPGHLVVVKSTVIPGTTRDVIKGIIAESAGHRNFKIAMVPEFLREGLAIEDFLSPFRIVIGVEEDETFEEIKVIYKD
jgi:UDPglucose 6-dehydrogenase